MPDSAPAHSPSPAPAPAPASVSAPAPVAAPAPAETAQRTLIAELQRELVALRVELARMNGHRYVTIHNSLWRLMGFQFLRGLAMGLGTVLGATVIVSLLALSLTKIDFIPIIGEWAARIAEQIQIRN